MFRYNTPSAITLFFPLVTWKKPKGNNTIYLTFDDGPHPEITAWVMDELEKHNAKATFFCVGDNVRKYPQVAQELLARGHKLGNHTHNHLNGWATSKFSYLRNVAVCNAYTKSSFFRPPYGKISMQQLLAVKKKYEIVFWSILSRDFEADLNTDESLGYMLANTKDGDIVLFHDSVKAEKNLKTMLPPFLSHFVAKGYTFAVL